MIGNTIRFAGVLLLAFCLESASTPAGAADQLEVGFGAVDVTPKLVEGVPIWLAGKEYNRPATGVHDPLFARAVVLRAGGRKSRWWRSTRSVCSVRRSNVLAAP